MLNVEENGSISMS